jgi:hypothetical protein
MSWYLIYALVGLVTGTISNSLGHSLRNPKRWFLLGIAIILTFLIEYLVKHYAS